MVKMSPRELLPLLASRPLKISTILLFCFVFHFHQSFFANARRKPPPPRKPNPPTSQRRRERLSCRQRLQTGKCWRTAHSVSNQNLSTKFSTSKHTILFKNIRRRIEQSAGCPFSFGLLCPVQLRSCSLQINVVIDPSCPFVWKGCDSTRVVIVTEHLKVEGVAVSSDSSFCLQQQLPRPLNPRHSSSTTCTHLTVDTYTTLVSYHVVFSCCKIIILTNFPSLPPALSLSPFF